MRKSPRCIRSIIVEKLRIQAVLSMKRTRVETIRTQSRLKTAKPMDDVCSDGTPVVKSMNSFTPTIKQPINRFVKESGSVESPLTQHDIERSNSTTVSTMTTADFNDVLQQNSNLKRDIEFLPEMGRGLKQNSESKCKNNSPSYSATYQILLLVPRMAVEST